MNYFYLFILLLFLYTELNLCENEKKDELFSNSELENIGGSAGGIITGSSNLSAHTNPHPSTTNVAGDIIHGLKSASPPIVELNEEALIDPDIVCERDYNIPCPEDYTYIGSVHKNDDEICAPSPTYDGPCIGEELNIKNMSDARKENWSMKCKTSWPCRKCVRDYTSFCPEKWNKVEGTIRSCKPSRDYMGPCKYQINFSGYNIEMLSDWSLKCEAWWVCDHIDLFPDCPDSDVPITAAATRWRLMKNYQ
ncbi:CPW-WPC family protein [Plasmodium vinckei vinckei]|uniref:CPW-WPC family protein n=1 Tax=Plasmodium vinckei vinckei TaxID=54757 RepID=A0A449BX62_PLAVN|nr:CPW-WPC family protein [Plasmodium vinckei vinckei]VEV58060.1 CPW-WPC family protein [Plasmodium vinckei vinckei]